MDTAYTGCSQVMAIGVHLFYQGQIVQSTAVKVVSAKGGDSFQEGSAGSLHLGPSERDDVIKRAHVSRSRAPQATASRDP